MKTINNNEEQLVTNYSQNYHAEIETELNSWQKENKVQRLWKGDKTLWTNQDEDKWLGWLDVAFDHHDIPSIENLKAEFKKIGIEHVVVLGMGGSSLCPAMLSETFGKIGNNPRLHVLDSTDPAQIRELEKQLDLTKTVFIVSSKSGTTLEPNIFKDYFFSKLQSVLAASEVGSRFLAITDPGTPLEQLAKQDKFKAVFYGVPSIGGRYSALSNFGMVPFGLAGGNVKDFLNNVSLMHQACSSQVQAKDNPGVVLGVILGICAKHNKNKVTMITSPQIESLASWLEQLLAESTGKEGKGLIPIALEPLGTPDNYDDDRIFVYIRLESAPDKKQDKAIDLLEQAGFVIVRLKLADKMHLGAEMFRWEIATAVAGSIIGINPFNQPDVEESKVLALKLTSEYEKTGQLQQPKPFFTAENFALYTDENLPANLGLIEIVRAHLDQIKHGDYVDLAAFIAMSDEHLELLQEIRILIRNNKKVATCLGFGPRFLHSTGQAYKGGPNTGVFLQLTADHKEDLQVPHHHYTFGLVITAQAQADFTVLAKRKRRILRINLGKDVQRGLNQLLQVVRSALQKE